MGMIIQNGILMSSSKVEIQPVIYSEEEREIGVWIDGKPLYEKTIAFTNSVNSYRLDVSALNIDYLVEAVARIHNNTGGDYSVAPYYEGSNDKLNYYFTSDKQSIIFRSGLTYTIGSGYVTIRYTKTTDTAGSGIWATTGLPAHHYSTSEQVVGTWVDGSTIYEKTLTPSDSYSSQFNYIPHGVSNLDQLLEYFGYCTYASSDKMNIPNIRGTSYVTVSSWDTTNIRLEKANLSSGISNVKLVIRYTKSY